MKILVGHLLVSLLISFLWSISAFSADNLCLGDKPVDSLSSGIGFYSKDNASCIPTSVRQAASSIFEQRVLAASSEESLRTVDLTTSEGAALKDRIKAIEPSLDFDEKDKIVLLKQIERCEKHELLEVKKNCIFSLEIRKSTGFIAGDNLSLWTNSHAIDGFVNAIKILNGKSVEDMKKESYPIRIFLFDSDGRLILNPYENEIRIEKLPEKSMIARVRDSFYAEDSDFVHLKLSKPVAQPLQIAENIPSLGNQVFLAGYSACTGCEPMSVGADPIDFIDRGKSKNSDGYGIKFSTGYVLEGKSLWTSFFGLSDQSAGLWRLDKMLFYSADSQHGNSGGPILNINGKVVGLHTGGLTKEVNNVVQRVSRGVLFPN